jgi:predicted nucleotidyltransferase component of viral defense system
MTGHRPTRDDLAGMAYLDLRRAARAAGRLTDEYLRLYILEGFLARLATSQHADALVIKGGVLLAAYDIRRPTVDVDVAAQGIRGQIDQIRDLVVSIASQPVDDGIVFDSMAVQAEQIRHEDAYAGVRVSLTASLATAVIRFHVDVNVGDPIWPEPDYVHLPRLLGGEITLRGYPLPMVLAEKIVTAVARGTANTRWRDFADVYLLTGAHTMYADIAQQAIRMVAGHRKITLRPLRVVHDGYADLGQAKWAAWRRKQKLDAVLPEQFRDVLVAVWAFTDQLLGADTAHAKWRTDTRQWG